MTSVTRPLSANRRRLIRHLFQHELRLLRRHGVLIATAVITVLWGVVVLGVDPRLRPTLLGWVLLFDLSGLGLFFVPALIVVERSQGIAAARQLTAVSPHRLLAVRITTMVWLSVVAAVALAVPSAVLAERPQSIPVVVLGVGLLCGLFSLAAVVVLGQAETVTDFLPRVPLLAIPLLVPAIVAGAGVSDNPLLHLSPVTGGLKLLQGDWSWAALGWLVTWTVLAWPLAARTTHVRSSVVTPVVARRAVIPISGPFVVMRSYARADMRTLAGDRLLLMVLAGVPILAVGARVFATFKSAWIDRRYGLDMTPWLPLVWAFVLVVHTPIMIGGIVGLLLLEDADAGLLPAVACTPAGRRSLLTYRLGVCVALSATTVVVAVPVAGAVHPAGWAGVALTAVATAAVSIVPALLLATVASDRLQGMAVFKTMSLPWYAPLALWGMHGAAGLPLWLIPTAWPVGAWWSHGLAAALWMTAGAVAMAGLWGTWLVQRWLTQSR